MSLKRKLDNDESPHTSIQSISATDSATPFSEKIYESTEIHDRSSTFKAIFVPLTSSPPQSATTPFSPRTFQHHPPFESASHRILAWRKPSTQRSLVGSFATTSSSPPLVPPSSPSPTITTVGSKTRSTAPSTILYEIGSDDDGEKYAGKKLEKLLSDLDVVGTVVVARWYGGVLLGPVRFKWIEDTAREAILKWKNEMAGCDAGDVDNRSGDGVKRAKVDVGGNGDNDDDPREKARLSRILRERDGSIAVLRGLLAEKTIELERLKDGNAPKEEDADGKKGDETTKSQHAAVPDYHSMPIPRLKQMEKARDATLGWILKQIDVVEGKINIQNTNKLKANDTALDQG